MIPPHSYSSLKMLKTCPHQWMRSYVKKDLPFFESPEMKYGNRVHTALEQRLRDKTPLPEDIRQHEIFCLPLDEFGPQVEIKLGAKQDGTPCGFFDRGVYLRGKLDVVVAAKDTAQLFDWKTGKPFEDPFELAVQALLLRINRPELKRLFGNYVWLKAGMIGKVHNLCATAVTWADIKLLHERAEKMMEAAKQGSIDAFPKVTNVLCGWCRVHDCEHNPERLNAANA